MLLSRKLCNQLNAAAKQNRIQISTSLKNISVNGVKRGCSGFVLNTDSGSCVYVNTEKSILGEFAEMSLYRYAADTQDYSSNGLKNGWNRFAPDKLLATEIISLLANGRGEPKD